MASQMDYQQLCLISLDDFIDKSKNLLIKVIGTIKTLFKHKKYIIEVYINRKLVIRSYKRFNQFQALHQLITMKYKNYKLEQMPSKFQFFGKQDTRKEYFQRVLKKIIKDHEHVNPATEKLEATKRRMLSIIYLFLTTDSQQEKDQKKKQRKISEESIEQSSYNDSLTADEGVKLQRFKSEFITTAQEGIESVKKSAQKNLKAISQFPISNIFQQNVEKKFFKEVSTKKKHKLSCDLENLNDSEEVVRPRCNSVEREFESAINQTAFNQNQFDVRFQNEDQWKRRYIYIRNSNLQLFKNKLDNNFKTKIQLFRITTEFLKRRENMIDHFCEKMEFNLTRTFKEDSSILSIYHQHDHQKILIKRPLKQGDDPLYNSKILLKLKEKLEEASNISPIVPNYEGVFNPIGKIFICLHTIHLSWKKIAADETIQIKIRTGALSYDARPIVYGREISLKQGFLIPVSSSFEVIKFQCITVKDQGFVKDNTQGKLMGSFSFTMAELLTKPCGHLFNKTLLKLETEQSKIEKYETHLEVSFQNFSDFSSIYSESYANQHDGRPPKPIKGFDDLDQLSLTVDRILRILGTIALLIQAFWRNAYLFKYPRLGYAFFMFLLVNAFLMQISDIVKQGFILFMIFILYQQPQINLICKHYLQRYIFSYIHPNFKKPMILSTSEVKYLKWANQMKYISEEYIMVDGCLQKSNAKKRTVFEFVVHDRKFYVREEEQSFFEKFKEAKKVIQLIHKMIDTVANAIEKVGNLVSWFDPKRTIALLSVILIFSGVASGYFVRTIITLFCIHRFVKGMHFYNKKHYTNNRRFAVFCLNYIIRKHFPQLITPKKTTKFEQMQEIVSNAIFPIHDDLSAKKLKLEMDEIMGVYLDIETMTNWAIKKNYLQLGILIDFVETCQSRLKLKWISGAEGISNEFQQLRQQTKEIPVIDVWIESLVINFIMNIPSQLYTTFWEGKGELSNIRKINNLPKNLASPSKSLSAKSLPVSKKEN